jgi:serine/threonine protein kinase
MYAGIAAVGIVVGGLLIYGIVVMRRRQQSSWQSGATFAEDTFPYVEMSDRAIVHAGESEPQKNTAPIPSQVAAGARFNTSATDSEIVGLSTSMAEPPRPLKLAFDQDTGFPRDSDTERWISLFWQGMTTMAQDESYHSFRIPYAVLAAATADFADAGCIGGGASCAVYKATVYGTWVAVKALNLLQSEEDEAVDPKQSMWEAKQFAAEMALLTAVRHPNICRLLGVSTDGGRRCLVLEYCPGGGLDTRLKLDRELMESGQAATLGWGQRLQIAVGIARALAHLHSLTPAMIHRDVKTQNVLLAHEHCSDWLANTKVADFGTVREDKRGRVDSKFGTAATGNRKTHGSTMNVVGTPVYMPNEYLLGRVGPKTDAFSFGIVLIELLTSGNGIDARNLVELSERPLHEELRMHPVVEALGWPKQVLEQMVGLVVRCTQHLARERSTVIAELPVLEAAIASVR